MKNFISKSIKNIVCTILLCFAFLESQAQSVYDFIAASPNHSTLTAAIDAAGLESVLSGPGDYSICSNRRCIWCSFK